MRRKAERGHVAGGIVYGYRNREVCIGDRRSHVLREIHPDEGAIIRRIFQMIAEGRGYARVAKVLNAEGVPSPTGRGWATSGVRACVLRELYRGRIVYGQTQWQDRGGERVKVATPPETWITVEAPALRIVDEALWHAAHRRLDTTRARYARLTAGKRVGRPEPTLESPYLLTGFVRCAGCGGGVSAQVVTSKKGATRSYYVCTTFRVRGPALRARGFRARLRDLDAAILDQLGRDVLTEDVLMDAARSAARHAAAQHTHAGPERLATDYAALRGTGGPSARVLHRPRSPADHIRTSPGRAGSAKANPRSLGRPLPPRPSGRPEVPA
jgi:site-specific DNA recombinase